MVEFYQIAGSDKIWDMIEVGRKFREPDFLVECGRAHGSFNLKMKKSSGGVVLVERANAGGEIGISYSPGLSCIYGYDGNLRRISYHLKEYLSALDSNRVANLPIHMQFLVRFMKKYQAEASVFANLKSNWFQVVISRGTYSKSLASFKLSEVLGRSFGVNVQVATGKNLELRTRITRAEGAYGIGAGVLDALYETTVPDKIDPSFLAEPLTREKIEQMLSGASGQMVSVL